MCGSCLLLVFLEAFVNVLAEALVLAIFVRVIMSWVPMRLPFGPSQTGMPRSPGSHGSTGIQGCSLR